jgi:HSP20 family molecular chaperone IbpA
MEPGGIDVTVFGDYQGREEEKKDNKRHYTRKVGSFERSFRLPAAIHLDKIEAAYEKGVLTITPRLRKLRQRRSK